MSCTAQGLGPLDGIRVVDWTIWQQGPVAGAMLGDLGAEVIKIEERERGDGGRAMLRFEGSDKSPYWEMNNRNKKSFAVDLKQPEGVALVRELIAGADVFIQNFRPSVAEKIGLDYETLSQRNPKLIYASASAFGPEGPERSSRAYDLLGQARSGFLLRTGHEDEPDTPDGGMADQMGAIMLAYGVLAGLMARERHGIGQKVDTSLLGSMMWLRGLPVVLELMKQDGKRAVSDMQKHMKAKVPTRRDPGNPLWNTFKCADGKWLALAILATDPHWPVVMEALGNPPELADAARYGDHWSRCANAREATEVLDRIFASQDRTHWLDRLTARGDLPVCAINTTEEAANDPQALINGYVTELDHPSHGKIRLPGFPIALSQTPARIHRQAPEFGEHTEEVLLEMLGYDWDRIGALRERKVI
ncbi:CaiB/BaiF CoA transferase family protein [Novosphingobium sp. JCM 18896]|uniref:CaiB/BaiF CoA transferase family protein n=1 Tax=Novosphingobium sp. JCM 18896 TaxID=2989731 RepID=UPI002223715D|nr:CoA transferase [Novosphingobium sp. JCM 18896]MCW1430719.1 CoA transferase [Novosphingobium sp. JCM 18896]